MGVGGGGGREEETERRGCGGGRKGGARKTCLIREALQKVLGGFLLRFCLTDTRR